MRSMVFLLIPRLVVASGPLSMSYALVDFSDDGTRATSHHHSLFSRQAMALPEVTSKPLVGNEAQIVDKAESTLREPPTALDKHGTHIQLETILGTSSLLDYRKQFLPRFLHHVLGQNAAQEGRTLSDDALKNEIRRCLEQGGQSFHYFFSQMPVHAAMRSKRFEQTLIEWISADAEELSTLIRRQPWTRNHLFLDFEYRSKGSRQIPVRNHLMYWGDQPCIHEHVALWQGQEVELLIGFVTPLTIPPEALTSQHILVRSFCLSLMVPLDSLTLTVESREWILDQVRRFLQIHHDVIRNALQRPLKRPTRIFQAQSGGVPLKIYDTTQGKSGKTLSIEGLPDLEFMPPAAAEPKAPTIERRAA